MKQDNYYNEDIYLDVNKNKEVLKEIEYLSDCFSIKREVNFREYTFLISEYTKYMEYIANLIRELSIKDNTISASLILDILIKRGIFSNDLEFKFDSKVDNVLVSYLGINVIKGFGCCRHIATFNSDIINKLGLMSDPLYCYITDRNICNAHNMKGNHVINLIEYNATLYGYDTVFSTLFRFVDSLKLESIYNDRNLHVYYKPYVDMIFNDMSIQNVLSLIMLFDKVKDNDILSYNEYIDICRYSYDMIDKNSDLINEFQNYSKKFVKKIMSELK